MRPKQTNKIYIDKSTLNESNRNLINDTAIIIQGPLELDEDFTLNTINYYSKIINPQNIILSTWIGENETILKK